MKNISTAMSAGFAAAISIAVLSYAESFLGATIILMAPIGASTVLVFGLPNSPLAQPKNVILGHLITAFIGVLFTQLIGVTPFTLAIATGLAVSAMLLTDTTHPPAGANPILIMLSNQSWSFILSPVLVCAVTVVAIGLLNRKLITSKKKQLS